MNETIKTQLNHRSIRQFKPLALTREEVNLLVDVARHTATSNFRQSYSIISITDETLKEEIAEIANQPYIPNAGHLFVFVVDQRRNTLIAEAKGAEALVQGSPERFISAFSDAMIAAQNVVVAAESLGMGTVYLGSILNDNAKLSELLKLPKYVYPAVGLAVGWPDQEPQLKPRLPRHVIHMENYYRDLEHPLEELKNYDAEVHEYYDLRDLNNRVDEFTTQIAKTMDQSVANRANTLKDLQSRDFHRLKKRLLESFYKSNNVIDERNSFASSFFSYSKNSGRFLTRL